MIDPASPDFANTPASGRRPRFTYQPEGAHVAPVVSIVTPFFNTGPEFEETVATVFGQSLQDWEWIVVDDGSTEPAALARLDTLRNRDPRVRVVVHAQNRGLSAARNTGFKLARAAYVAQLDSDDLLEPTALEMWLWFLVGHPEFGFVKGYSLGFGTQEYLWTKGFHDRERMLDENVVDATCMIRRDVHRAVGGYEETRRGGLEDWDFWLRCANAGIWGETVPEFLNWYRRRESHTDRWVNLSNERMAEFRSDVARRYPALRGGGFPHIRPRWHMPHDDVPDAIPHSNTLAKPDGVRRLLMIVPWLKMGGADKFNLDVTQQLHGNGWEVSLATTLGPNCPWLPQFASVTPDVFVLPHFLKLVDYPRFLRYLISSRRIDVVMLSNSEIGYLLLPYLRHHCPDVTFVDFCHMEEEYWNNGGHPRTAVEHQPVLDLNVVSSQHLKRWMIGRGADGARIEVCYTNVDTEHWRPDAERRTATRQEIGISPDSPVILYAGRLADQKQPPVFARTMLELHQKGHDFVALVAGDGPHFLWLKDFVRTHSLGVVVRLMGALPNARVRDILNASDVFFLPSRQEGISLAIYEAMASGVVPVGADVGGQRELVTPECGVLIPPSDEATESAQYVTVLADLLSDPVRLRHMGERGRERVQLNFRVADMARRIRELFTLASELRQQQPRPTPSAGIANITGAQAVEHTRLVELAETLWAERNALLGHVNPSAPTRDALVPATEFSWWRRFVGRVAFAGWRILRPIYRWGMQRDQRWMQTVRDRLAAFLLVRRAPDGKTR